MTTHIPACCIELVKLFEGYGKRLPDGRCAAYQEKINGKLDIPTIGYGCTKGVTMGMIWTEAEAEEALCRELRIHAERVTRLITIELNDHERGALISFDYNTGGLKGNTLKAINSGDRKRAVAALKQWNKFGGKECAGLVRRRAAEVALFLKPVEEPYIDFMPQQPDAPGACPVQMTAATGAALSLTGVSAASVSEWLGVAQEAQPLLSGIHPTQFIVPLLIITTGCAAIYWLRGST